MVDRTFVDKILVPHEAFTLAEDRLEQVYAYIDQGAVEPSCLAIVGDSRTGKTRIATRFQSRHPPVRSAAGLETPVLLFNVPSKPTIKGMAELALKALGATDWDRGTETQKTGRLGKLIEECNVRILYLEEFQHFHDRMSSRVQHTVADWLKVLINERKIGLVVSGLARLQNVINQDIQLAGRFSRPIHLPRFDWADERQRKEWKRILKSFDKAMRTQFELPSLHDDAMAFRLYVACGGLIGYLSNVLRQAVWNALDKGQSQISADALCTAHMEAVWKFEGEGGVSPLNPKVQISPNAELLAKARELGQAADPEPPRYRSRKPKDEDSLGEVLSRR